MPVDGWKRRTKWRGCQRTDRKMTTTRTRAKTTMTKVINRENFSISKNFCSGAKWALETVFLYFEWLKHEIIVYKTNVGIICCSIRRGARNTQIQTFLRTFRAPLVHFHFLTKPSRAANLAFAVAKKFWNLILRERKKDPKFIDKVVYAIFK